jgi:hypothetical protein
MDFFAQSPFGPDAHAVAGNQHPHHQFGINRGAADAAVERLQLRAHLLEIEKSVDASKQVIFRDVVIEAEIVKQLRRRRLHPHHGPAPPQSNTRMEVVGLRARLTTLCLRSVAG